MKHNKLPTTIEVKQIHARPFQIEVRRDAQSVYQQAKAMHHREMWRCARIALHNIWTHHLLLKQAKLVYKIGRRG